MTLVEDLAGLVAGRTLALLVFAYAICPYVVLWMAVRLWPRDHPRRQELLAEYDAVPLSRRPFWVGDIATRCVLDGLAARWALRRDESADRLMRGVLMGTTGGVVFWLGMAGAAEPRFGQELQVLARGSAAVVGASLLLVCTDEVAHRFAVGFFQRLYACILVMPVLWAPSLLEVGTRPGGNWPIGGTLLLWSAWALLAVLGGFVRHRRSQSRLRRLLDGPR